MVESENKDVSFQDLANLAKSVARGENAYVDNVIEWIDSDTNVRCFEHVIDEHIIKKALVRNFEDSYDEDSKILRKMSHDTTLAHVDRIQ